MSSPGAQLSSIVVDLCWTFSFNFQFNFPNVHASLVDVNYEFSMLYLVADITIELRAMGVPWTLHCWMNALAAAHELRLDTVIDQLLQDFLQVCPDDYSQQFVMECLPLLFSIFRYSKVCVSNNFIFPFRSRTPYGSLLSVLFVLYNFYERTHKSITWLRISLLLLRLKSTSGGTSFESVQQQKCLSWLHLGHS